MKDMLVAFYIALGVGLYAYTLMLIIPIGMGVLAFIYVTISYILRESGRP